TPSATPHLPTPSLHDALPISNANGDVVGRKYDNGESPGSIGAGIYEYFGEFSPSSAYTRRVSTYSGIPQGGESYKGASTVETRRSEEHTSELQSRFDLVCRLL